ncbi:unnamed protein product [Brassica napus]|uniref:(rape) hypothetical protein n=1 Tax=Brassica napus TaxID=3708 RepID=A0A816Y0I7_BRANA|nr:unnamed protein product [Brassica napus]
MKDKLFFCLVQICFFSYIIRRRIQQRFPDTRDGLATNGLSISEQLGEQKSPETPKSPLPCTDFDAAYSHSYAHVRIHEEMIKGIFFFVYPLAVVDVGCGTGILSIFCAQAGAKRVYAVDASDIAVQAEEVLKANGLSDKVIVLHGRDVEIEEEADVIVSEWMGYMLLYESMLGSVITARDSWLKPGGLILPSHATLYMAPISHPDRYSHSIGFWRNVYGIDSK